MWRDRIRSTLANYRALCLAFQFNNGYFFLSSGDQSHWSFRLCSCGMYEWRCLHLFECWKAGAYSDECNCELFLMDLCQIAPCLALGSPCVFFESLGSRLLAVTSDGKAVIWNVSEMSVELETSVASVFGSARPQATLESTTLTPDGRCILMMSSGESYCYSEKVRSSSPLYCFFKKTDR